MTTNGTGNRPKCVHIEMHFSDGMIQEASGEDAATIHRAITDAFLCQQIHGIPYQGPKLRPRHGPKPLVD